VTQERGLLLLSKEVGNGSLVQKGVLKLKGKRIRKDTVGKASWGQWIHRGLNKGTRVNRILKGDHSRRGGGGLMTNRTPKAKKG